MEQQLYSIVFVLLGLVIAGALAAIVWAVIQKQKKRNQEKYKYTIYRGRRKSYNRFYFGLYQRLNRVPIIKIYLRKISRRFELIYPGELRQIGTKTMKLALAVWFVCGLILIFLFLAKPTFYHLCLTALLIWVSENEMVNYVLGSAEERLLKQFDQFLTDVRHYYYLYKTAEDAIAEAMEHSGSEMRIQAEEIYHILTAEDMQEELSRFNATSHNNFIKLFVGQCVNAMEYGDKQVEGQSLFLQNILNLKTDLRIELLRREKLKFVFSFAVVLIVFPVMALELCSSWAIGNLASLEAFYTGKLGIAIMVFLLLETAVLYYVVDKLKHAFPPEIKTHKILSRIERVPFIRTCLRRYQFNNYGQLERLRQLLKKLGENITPRQLLVKQAIFAILALLCGFCISFWMHGSTRNYITTSPPDFASLVTGASQEEIKGMEQGTLRLINYYKTYSGIEVEVIKKELMEEGMIRNEAYAKTIAGLIQESIIQYQREYFHWYELIFIFFASYLSFWLPYWFILYRKKLMQGVMDDEVIQFQSIILMMMHFDRVTTLDILEMMERFASIFRSSIQDCINEYGGGDLAALETLKEKENFEPFRRIVDNFLIADKIGIEKAFDEISADRLNFQQKRQQENEINLQKKANMATMLSLLPILSVMFLYLIGPFVIASLNEYNSFSAGLTSTVED